MESVAPGPWSWVGFVSVIGLPFTIRRRRSLAGTRVLMPSRPREARRASEALAWKGRSDDPVRTASSSTVQTNHDAVDLRLCGRGGRCHRSRPTGTEESDSGLRYLQPLQRRRERAPDRRRHCCRGGSARGRSRMGARGIEHGSQRTAGRLRCVPRSNRTRRPPGSAPGRAFHAHVRQRACPRHNVYFIDRSALLIAAAIGLPVPHPGPDEPGGLPNWRRVVLGRGRCALPGARLGDSEFVRLA